ncbi:MAG: hypothetical protein JWQ66_3188 [Mucilaginibacter sp.]|nr:hypothetical protein [Mucilaginibacter sp.]
MTKAAILCLTAFYLLLTTGSDTLGQAGLLKVNVPAPIAPARIKSRREKLLDVFIF